MGRHLFVSFTPPLLEREQPAQATGAYISESGSRQRRRSTAARVGRWIASDLSSPSMARGSYQGNGVRTAVAHRSSGKRHFSRAVAGDILDAVHLFRHGGVSHWCDAHGNTCSIYDKLIEWWWFIISCAASDTGVRCGDGEKKAHLAQYTQKPHELRGRPMPSRRGLASLKIGCCAYYGRNRRSQEDAVADRRTNYEI